MANRVIESNSKRKGTYVAGAVVIIAAVLATMIQLDVFTLETVRDWFTMVALVVAGIVGGFNNIMAALNTDNDEDEDLEYFN